jgi:hypothetical protein
MNQVHSCGFSVIACEFAGRFISIATDQKLQKEELRANRRIFPGVGRSTELQFVYPTGF